jgi:hypothetical protein
MVVQVQCGEPGVGALGADTAGRGVEEAAVEGAETSALAGRVAAVFTGAVPVPPGGAAAEPLAEGLALGI